MTSKYIKAMNECDEFVKSIYEKGTDIWSCMDEIMARLDGVTSVAHYDEGLKPAEFEAIIAYKQNIFDEWFSVLDYERSKRDA